MAIDPKEAFEYIGVNPEEFDSLDDFKAAYNKQYVGRDAAKQDEELRDAIFGQQIGAMETKLKQTFKEAGVEFEQGELKDLKYHDVLNKGLEKLTTTYSSQIEEAKKNSGGDIDQRIQELTQKLEKKDKTLQEERQLRETSIAQLSKEKEELMGNMKQYKIGVALDGYKKQLKLKEGITPVELKGFEAEIKDRYRFDFGDEGDLVVTDSKGNRIQSPEKAGKFMDPLDALSSLAKESGLYKSNPHTTSTRPASTHRFGGEGAANGEGKPLRELPAAVAAAKQRAGR